MSRLSTLFRHSALYLVARCLSGGLNFLTLAIYSRILSPSDYGRYAMAVVIVGLGDAILFHWLRLGVFRFLPSYEKHPEAFRATIAIGFLGLVGLSGVATLVVMLAVSDPALRQLIWAAVLLLWVQAWFQLNLEWVRCQLSPQRYGYMVCIKSVLVVVFGGTFTWYWQWGPLGPVYGLAVGTFVPVCWQTWTLWRRVCWKAFDGAICRQLLDYGLPLAANGMLAFVVHSSDRVLLGWWHGTDAIGLYAAGYDLANHALITLMMTVQLAAYPLVVRALEDEGAEAAREQLVQYATLFLAAILPGMVILTVLASNVAGVVLGATFRASALTVIPWIALATLLHGIKAYYTDLSFHLGKSTRRQAGIMAIAAGVNLGLNLWWIPPWGLHGALAATVAAYSIALGLSWRLGRGIWSMPVPKPVMVQLTVIGVVLAGALWPLRHFSGALALLGQIAACVGGYAGLLLAFDVGHCREAVRSVIRRHEATIRPRSHSKDQSS